MPKDLYSLQEYLEENDNNDRGRMFMILLYPDSESYDFEEVLFKVHSEFKYYAYIMHLPETDEKKEHCHLILKFDDPVYRHSLSNKLGIPLQFIKLSGSQRGSCRYLTHIDFPTKKQYSIMDVTFPKSFAQEYTKHFDDLLTDDEILDNIMLFIADNKCDNPVILEMNLVKYVSLNNFNRVFKRYYNSITKYINNVCSNRS